MTLPLVDFFIVGAMKSGTSSLRDALGKNDNIDMARGEPKFFSHDKVYQNGFDWYHSLFDTEKQYAARGDKSPNYAFVPSAPERIYQYNPNAKIIWLFRSPARRAISNFYHARNRTEAAISLEEAIAKRDELEEKRSTMAYVYRSEYPKHIAQYRKFFPDHQQLFLIFEEMVADPAAVLKDVHSFLGVPFDETVTLPNETKRFPHLRETIVVPDETKAKLSEVLSPTVDAMERIMGRPIAAWKS